MKTLIVRLFSVGSGFLYETTEGPEKYGKFSGDLAFSRSWTAFEALDAQSFVPFHLHEHFERLLSSCRRMRIPVAPLMPETEFAGLLTNFLKKCRYKSAGIGIYVSRGESRDNSNPYGLPYIKVDVWPQEYGLAKPVKLMTISDLSRSWPEVKSTDGYGKTCARREEAREKGFDSFVYCTDSSMSQLKEEAFSNIFGITSESTPRLITPEYGVLHGITRGLVLDLAFGLTRDLFTGGVQMCPIYYSELWNGKFAEMFITSSFKGVAEVACVDDCRFRTGPDTITARLKQAFLKYREEYYFKRR